MDRRNKAMGTLHNYTNVPNNFEVRHPCCVNQITKYKVDIIIKTQVYYMLNIANDGT
jgi:hypothetical protein